MLDSLLATKLHIPQPGPGFVPRERLVERLEAGLRGKLVLLSAPAGFGKTWLLSEWASHSQSPVAWITLDKSDNDPARFLAYLVAALRKIDARLGEFISGALQGPQAPDSGSILTTLVNEISRKDADFVFILDDYHIIKANAVHSMVIYLLDHSSPGMHWVIATRSDPPLPLARLRAKGQLTELRLVDLRFSPDEANAFMNQATDLDLSTDEIKALAYRTEGWVAGLQMAIIALQGRMSSEDNSLLRRERTSEFIRAFTGSNRYVMDYLIEEVLAHQTESIQTFLLYTSILDRLTGPLCDFVIGRDENPPDVPGIGQEILELLERSNLFILPMDEERHWYRYHRLFSDLLRKRLRQVQPEIIPNLHLRASHWFEDNGQIAPAIDHALAGGNIEQAAGLIERFAEATMMRSEVSTLLKWVSALPDELVGSRPSLGIYHACALLFSGHSIQAVEALLQDIDKGDPSMAGEMAVLKGSIAIQQGRIDLGVEHSREALTKLPEEDIFLHNLAAWNLAMAPVESDDLVAARDALAEVARKGQKAGNVTVTVGALCAIAKFSTVFGRIHEAADIYKRALKMAMDRNGECLPIAGGALVGLGDLYREWNDLQEATRYLNRGIELATQLRMFYLDGFISLALVYQAQGNDEGVRETIQKAQQLGDELESSKWDLANLRTYQARFSIVQGDVAVGVRWAEKRGLTAGIAFNELEESETMDVFIRRKRRWAEYLTLARLLVALNKPDEAMPFLDRLLRRAERLEMRGRTIGVQILRTLALNSLGDERQAMASLEQALSLGEPEGYVRVFLDEGPAMIKLLQIAVSSGIEPVYAKVLLSRDDAQMMSPAVELQPVFRQALVEPLSERELQVLRLLGTNLTAPEIAEELYVAVSTIRTHTKNIYTKLGVHRRREAVDRARELGLI